MRLSRAASRGQRRAAMLVGAFAAACTRSPRIESFAAAPDRVNPGETATLSWKVRDASSIALRDATGASVEGVPAAAFTGSAAVSPLETTTYVLAAYGSGTDLAVTQVRVGGGGATFPFVAAPGTIAPGQAAALVWNAPAPPAIVDDDGKTYDAGGRAAGSITVWPQRTTSYVATVGALRAGATVGVLPGIASFEVNPTGALAGAKVRLAWIVNGATEVTLSDAARGKLHTAAADALGQGSFEDTVPALPLGAVITYRLTATNAAGMATQDVPFVVADAPTLRRFLVPQAVTRGKDLTVAWQFSTNVVRAVLWANGVAVYRSPITAAAVNGNFVFPKVSADVALKIVGETAAGSAVSGHATCRAVAPAQIVAWSLNKTVVGAAGDAVVASWKTSGAVEISLLNGYGVAFYSTRDPAKLAAGTADVYPAQRTSVKLVAANAAADAAESIAADVEVLVPASALVTPSPALPSDPLTLSWDVAGAVEVLGAPSPGVKATAGGGGFVELDGDPAAHNLGFDPNTLAFGCSGGEAAALGLPFAFPFFGQLHRQVIVDTNGVISMQPAWSATGCNPAVAPSEFGFNNWIAPFWDDLQLTPKGKVLVRFIGNAPERRLIVEWSKVRPRGAAYANVELTFEAILYENGRVQFLYQALKNTGAPDERPFGASATVGAESEAGFNGAIHLVNGASAGTPVKLAEGDQLEFFGSAGARDSLSGLRLLKVGTYALFARVGAAKWMPVVAPAAVVNRGDLLVTEVMYKPLATAAKGQWVEIYNRTANDLPVGGMSLDASTAASSVKLPSGIAIGARQAIVVARSRDPVSNGETPVDVEDAALAVSPSSDTVSLWLGTQVLSSLAYSDASLSAPAGTSVMLDTNLRTSGFLATPLCLAREAYGSAGSRGSPGRSGSQVGCHYTIETVPARFEDVSGTGTLVWQAGPYPARTRIVFPAGFDFAYWGKAQTQMIVGSGYLSFDSTRTETPYDSYPYNPFSFPSPYTWDYARNVVAAFWDGFYRPTGAPPMQVFFKSVDPDRDPSTNDEYLVVQFHHMTYSTSAPHFDLNFEAKLHESGDIEFQYDVMAPGLISGLEKGSSATVGVSDEAGNLAVVFSHNAPDVPAKSGLVFRRQ